jgi:hypothetical protein
VSDRFAHSKPLLFSHSSLLCLSQLLTGDASAKLRDSIFNFDIHSPNPNALYRQRHSVVSSSAQPRTSEVKSSRSRQSTTRDPNRISHRPPLVPAPVPSGPAVTIFRQPQSRVKSSSLDPTPPLTTSPLLHKIIRSNRESAGRSALVSDQSRDEGSSSTKKSAPSSGRGTKTKYQIELESDDITSPMHFSPLRRSDGFRSRTVEEGLAIRSSDGHMSQRSSSIHEDKRSYPISQRGNRGGTPTRGIVADPAADEKSSRRKGTESQGEGKSRYSLRSLLREKGIDTKEGDQEEGEVQTSVDQRWSVPVSAKKNESKRPVSMRNISASTSLNNFKK